MAKDKMKSMRPNGENRDLKDQVKGAAERVVLKEMTGLPGVDDPGLDPGKIATDQALKQKALESAAGEDKWVREEAPAKLKQLVVVVFTYFLTQLKSTAEAASTNIGKFLNWNYAHSNTAIRVRWTLGHICVDVARELDKDVQFLLEWLVRWGILTETTEEAAGKLRFTFGRTIYCPVTPYPVECQKDVAYVLKTLLQMAEAGQGERAEKIDALREEFYKTGERGTEATQAFLGGTPGLYILNVPAIPRMIRVPATESNQRDTWEQDPERKLITGGALKVSSADGLVEAVEVFGPKGFCNFAQRILSTNVKVPIRAPADRRYKIPDHLFRKWSDEQKAGAQALHGLLYRAKMLADFMSRAKITPAQFFGIGSDRQAGTTYVYHKVVKANDHEYFNVGALVESRNKDQKWEVRIVPDETEKDKDGNEKVVRTGTMNAFDLFNNSDQEYREEGEQFKGLSWALGGFLRFAYGKLDKAARRAKEEAAAGKNALQPEPGDIELDGNSESSDETPAASNGDAQ